MNALLLDDVRMSELKEFRLFYQKPPEEIL